MKVLNDFGCSNCGTTVEKFVENDVKAIECQNCLGIATKIRSVPNFHLEGITGDYPTASDKWVKDRERRLKKETDNS